jgi:hypothetical protein
MFSRAGAFFKDFSVEGPTVQKGIMIFSYFKKKGLSLGQTLSVGGPT